jgi:hypothetical protein
MVNRFKALGRAGQRGFDEVESGIIDAKDALIVAKSAAEGFKSSIKTIQFDPIATDMEFMFGLLDEQTELRLTAALDIQPVKDELMGLKALWSEYYQSESARNAVWYEQQKELHKGNKEALFLIDQVYDAKKTELTDKEASEEQNKLTQLREQYNQQFLTQAELLDEWYAQEQEKYSFNQQALEEIRKIYEARKIEGEEALALKRKEIEQNALSAAIGLAAAFGKKGLKLMQGLSIAQATMKAYEAFNMALASVPYPYNFIAAATTLAAGLTQVASIAAQKPPSAHGGLTNVPREQSYLLDRGERVVSPQQNKDLTEFIQRTEEGGAGLSIENVVIEVLPNATNIDAFMSMDKNDIRDLVEEKLIEPFRDLKKAGIVI